MNNDYVREVIVELIEFAVSNIRNDLDIQGSFDVDNLTRLSALAEWANDFEMGLVSADGEMNPILKEVAVEYLEDYFQGRSDLEKSANELINDKRKAAVVFGLI